MRENITHAIEDYLKTIYELTRDEGRATTNQIAERMEVKPASVSGMIKRLVANEPPLVKYRKHHGVILTLAGEQVALEIIRHHRLLEMFLHETLGYSWDQVHDEADRLEHVISENFEEAIARSLGEPVRDPHGEPIPTRELHVPDETAISLSDLRSGQQATVQRVEDDDPDLLRYLQTVGLMPEVRLKVLDYSPFDGNLSLEITGGENPVVLGPRVTRQVYVEIE